MTDIVKNIRKSVLKTIMAKKLTDIVYGTVESVSPIKIRVDAKLLLEPEQIKLTRAVKDYEVELTETPINDSDNVEISRRKIKIYNGLIIGDKVTMIRQHGGQQYIVIDKEVDQ